MIYCLAFDPGRHCGWAILSKEDRSKVRPSFFEGGVIEGRDMAAQVADRLRASAGMFGRSLIVGVETIAGFTHGRKGRGVKALTKHINEASEFGGEIAGMARMMALPVTKMPATEWRRIVGAGATGSDADVKACLSVLVAGLPKKSNAHLRDAVGCAYGTLQRSEVQRTTVHVTPFFFGGDY